MQRLKILPEFFEPILEGEKRFEVRSIKDRSFTVGESLMLDEWTPGKEYTGRSVEITITFILYGGQYGIELDYVVFGFVETRRILR